MMLVVGWEGLLGYSIFLQRWKEVLGLNIGVACCGEKLKALED